MDVVCVIDTVVGDHLEDRICALEEIKQAVQAAGANFQRVQVNGLSRLYNVPMEYVSHNGVLTIPHSSSSAWISGRRMCWRPSTMPM